MHYRRTLGVLALLALSVPALAAGAKPKLVVVTDRPEATYKRGETATFNVSLVDEGGTLVGGRRVTVTFTRDGVGPATTATVETSAERPVGASYTYADGEPGVIRCVAAYEELKLTAVAGAAFDPGAIRPSLPAPADFESYWREQVKLVHDEPMDPVMTAVAAPGPGLVAHDVTVNCPGGAPLSGYLVRPAGARPRSLPAVLFPHSAGVRSSQLEFAARGAGWGAVALDFNAHGLPNGKPNAYYAELMNGRLKGYPAFGREDRETIYFRGMLLRLIRALQFIKAQPEWDGRTLIVYGSSQGGGQALIAAGLDPDVTACLASVPAMCDHTGFAAGRASGWPKLVPVADGKADAKVAAVARYFDAMNFAPRVRAETHVTVGLVDATCPPTSVYAAYNAIPGGPHKEIIVRPLMGHEFPRDLVERFDDLARRHIESRRGSGDGKGAGT